ncbi:ATP-binding protein [Glutamicibacter arilaitensis]|uniref:ATP-binding protein n=1 Tax=Glutamicibacter arilaitensis TaxID=256701 RepID=UPI00384CF334
MRLTEMEIRGFRGYSEKLTIGIDSKTTTIIGRNDAGKSSLLEALDIFLGSGKLDSQDFSVKNSDEIEISCTFMELPESIVIDSSRTTSLEAEYLLTNDRKLKLIKTWSRSKLSTPSLSAWALHPELNDGTDLLNSKIDALRAKAAKLSIPDGDIDDRRTSSSYRAAIWRESLRTSEATLVDKRVPLTTNDGKQVATTISNYLPLFQLFKADRQGDESDKVAQDPATAVIKSVLEEHSDELAGLSSVIQEKVSDLLREVVTVLQDIAPQVAKSLSPSNPSPNWAKAYSGLQFTDENDVPLAKRGSGTRRLVLLSFFRATAERALRELEQPSEQYHRGVITAVEEPETALHADLQTEIINSLLDIGDLPHRQVILTTHSANLIRLVPVDSIRYISSDEASRRTCTIAKDPQNAEDLLVKLNESLGVFSDHNVRCFVLIEGRNDITGLKNLSASCQDHGIEGVHSFSDLEAKGLICFLPIGGGGSASLWNSNLSPFRRHEIYIMDSDRLESTTDLKPEMKKLMMTADDLREVHILDSREMENYLTHESIQHAYSDFAKFDEEFDDSVAGLEWKYVDVPTVVAKSLHNVNAPADTAWDELPKEKQDSKESRAKKRLASAFSHPSVSQSLADESTDLLEILRSITIKALH